VIFVEHHGTQSDALAPLKRVRRGELKSLESTLKIARPTERRVSAETLAQILQFDVELKKKDMDQTMAMGAFANQAEAAKQLTSLSVDVSEGLVNAGAHQGPRTFLLVTEADGACGSNASRQLEDWYLTQLESSDHYTASTSAGWRKKVAEHSRQLHSSEVKRLVVLANNLSLLTEFSFSSTSAETVEKEYDQYVDRLNSQQCTAFANVGELLLGSHMSGFQGVVVWLSKNSAAMPHVLKLPLNEEDDDGDLEGEDETREYSWMEFALVPTICGKPHWGPVFRVVVEEPNYLSSTTSSGK
jgi:hypothetical protein